MLISFSCLLIIHLCSSFLRFFLRKINWSAWSPLSTLRWEETISPAVLKTLSDATLVAGMQRYLFTISDNNGKSTCAIHHSSGLPFRGKRFLSPYLRISSLTFSLELLDGLTTYVSPNSWSSAVLFLFLQEGQSPDMQHNYSILRHSFGIAMMAVDNIYHTIKHYFKCSSSSVKCKCRMQKCTSWFFMDLDWAGLDGCWVSLIWLLNITRTGMALLYFLVVIVQNNRDDYWWVTTD